MNEKVKLEFSFEKEARILSEESEELKEFERYFQSEILPEIKEVEKRKRAAQEKAYQIRVCCRMESAA